jgi:hypothetical protein
MRARVFLLLLFSGRRYLHKAALTWRHYVLSAMPRQCIEDDLEIKLHVSD